MSEKDQAALQKKHQKINLDILHTDKRILELTYQDKLLETRKRLTRIIEIGEFLENIKDKEYISLKEAKKLVKKNKEFLDIFRYEGENAYINRKEFDKYHDEFKQLEEELEKEQEFLFQ